VVDTISQTEIDPLPAKDTYEQIIQVYENILLNTLTYPRPATADELATQPLTDTISRRLTRDDADALNAITHAVKTLTYIRRPRNIDPL